MTLDELKLAVYELTSRPDLASLTFSSIQNATLSAHTTEDLPRDILEKAVVFPGISYTHDIEHLSVFPRFRRVRYMRNYADNTPGNFLTRVSPLSTLDAYGAERQDVYYLAGDFIHLRTASLTDRILAGVLCAPNVTAEGYDSWIARETPQSIIYGATSLVLRKIGYAEDSQFYLGLAREEIQKLIQQSLEGDANAN